MATFVLIHGAWHGGWCWKKVTPLLRSAGHDVYMPTLTGLGERSHLSTPDIDLDTHITDVVNLLECEGLHNVILVGHSYGGLVMEGVAIRDADRLHQLVNLDGEFPIDDDRSMAGLLGRLRPAVWASLEARMRESGDRWLIAAPNSGETLFGVTEPHDLEWMHQRFVAHPAKTFLQRVPDDNEKVSHLPRAYIYCPVPEEHTTYPFAQRARSNGWGFHEIAGAGHDAMITKPEELSRLLVTLATATA